MENQEFDLNLSNYTIKSKHSYDELRDRAVLKLMYSVHRYIKTFFTLLLPFALIALLFLTLTLMSDPQVQLIFGFFRNFFIYFLVLFGIIAYLGTYNLIKKLIILNRVYKHDLRAILEKLEYSEIYMDIPDEDYNRFNNPVNILRAYNKNRKEYKRIFGKN